MSTIDMGLEWGQDLTLTPQGTIQFVAGWDQVRQRIIRRILTNPAQTLPAGNSTAPDYVFDTAYGIGGGALVSQNPTRAWKHSLSQRITQGVLSDVAVDPGFLPQIVIQQPQPNMVEIFVGIQLISGQKQAFGLTIGPQANALVDEGGNALKDEDGNVLYDP